MDTYEKQWVRETKMDRIVEDIEEMVLGCHPLRPKKNQGKQQPFLEIRKEFSQGRFSFLNQISGRSIMIGLHQNNLKIRRLVRNNQKIDATFMPKSTDEFGFGSIGLAVEDFENSDRVVQLGVPPVRIDIMTSLSGVSWEEAYSNSEEGEYGGVPVKYIGQKQFILNKRATGRQRDLSDLEALDAD